MLALLTCKSDGENRIAVTMASASVKRQIVGNRLAVWGRVQSGIQCGLHSVEACIWDRCYIQSRRSREWPEEGPGTHPKLELT